MEVYKRETRDVVRRLGYRQLSFSGCILRVDAALVRFIPRLKPEQLDELRAVMFENNDRVMDEMIRRQPKETPEASG